MASIVAFTMASISGVDVDEQPTITPTTKATNIIKMSLMARPSIVESRYAGDYIPKFQAKFGVAEEEPDGPFQGLVQRNRQGFDYHAL